MVSRVYKEKVGGNEVLAVRVQEMCRQTASVASVPIPKWKDVVSSGITQAKSVRFDTKVVSASIIMPDSLPSNILKNLLKGK